MKQAPRHGRGYLPHLLLTLVLAQGMGWFLAWQGLQWQAKITAHKALFREHTALITITLEQGHFIKIKAGKREIRLNGNLYDIRSSEARGDSIQLVVYHDKREQALYGLLGIHFSQLDGAVNSRPEPVPFLIAQWLGAAFLQPEGVAFPVWVQHRHKAHFNWRFPETAAALPPPFMPPRMI